MAITACSIPGSTTRRCSAVTAFGSDGNGMKSGRAEMGRLGVFTLSLPTAPARGILLDAELFHPSDGRSCRNVASCCGLLDALMLIQFVNQNIGGWFAVLLIDELNLASVCHRTTSVHYWTKTARCVACCASDYC